MEERVFAAPGKQGVEAGGEESSGHGSIPSGRPPFLPGIDESGRQHGGVGEEEKERRSLHFPENEGPGEEKGDFDVEQDEEEDDERKLDGETGDPLLKRRAAAFERLLLDGVGLPRAEKRVQGNHDRAEKAEHQEDQGQGHGALSSRERQDFNPISQFKQWIARPSTFKAASMTASESVGWI
jgi:hypothetical protein